MTLTPDTVNRIAGDCMYYRGNEEIPDPPPTADDHPEDMILVDAIVHTMAFKATAVAEHKDEIRDLLMELPTEFRSSEAGGSGGWSFLNSCDTAAGEQWTGEHRTMASLWSLGIAAGLAAYLMPRDLWSSLPGGMPYLVITANA